MERPCLTRINVLIARVLLSCNAIMYRYIDSWASITDTDETRRDKWCNKELRNCIARGKHSFVNNNKKTTEDKSWFLELNLMMFRVYALYNFQWLPKKLCTAKQKLKESWVSIMFISSFFVWLFLAKVFCLCYLDGRLQGTDAWCRYHAARHIHT